MFLLLMCTKGRWKEGESRAAVFRVDLRNNSLGRRPGDCPGVMCAEERRGWERKGEVVL